MKIKEVIDLGRHQKWVILFNVCSMCMQTIILNYNIIPLNVSLNKAYGLDPKNLSYVYVAGSLGLIVAYPILSIILLRLGLKWGLIIGYTISIAGIFLETLLQRGKVYLMAGYFLCRFGASVSTLSFGQIINLWFPSTQVGSLHLENCHFVAGPIGNLWRLWPRA